MKKTILALTLVAAAISGAQAGIIESDDFNYPDGPIVANSTWISNSGSGAGKEMDVTNATLIVFGSRSEDIYHFLTGQPYMTNGSTANLYARYTVTCTNLPNALGTYFSHFGGTNVFTSSLSTLTGHRCKVWASLTNYSAGGLAGTGQWFINILNSGTTGVNPVTWPTALDTNVTYTVVTRYNVATAQSTLWINPTAETDSNITDTSLPPYDFAPGFGGIPQVQNGPANISAYDFRQASGEGLMGVDGLRVGTIFADVAGNNQSPAIASIPDQSIPANANTGPIPFTVQDPETLASGLTVTATSGNTTLVPNVGISLGSDVGGTNRTITVTPASGQQGSAIITVNVSDSVNTSSTTFKVTVGAPSISSIPNQQAYSNTAIPAVLFTVADAENDALTFTKTSSNPTLVTAGDIVIGTSGSSSNLTITPEPNQIGIATITISVGDGHNTNSTSFVLTISPKVGVVYNENFAYTDFSVGQPNALYGAAGGSGAPWNHVSGPLYELQVTNVNVTSGLAYIVGTNNEDLGADFIGFTVYQGTNGFVFYTSFTVDCSFLPTPLGDYFFHLAASGSDSSSFHDKVFANKANAAAGKFRLGVSNVGAEVQHPRDLTVGATYVVVTRFNAGTGESTLWVNPVNEQSSSVVATDTPGLNTIGGVALRQTSGTGDLAVGPMKVGTQFSDVFTAPAAPVLNYVISGGNIILSWNNPLFVLQSASDVNGPYTDVAVSSPSSNPISGNQFFRLKY